MKWLAPTGSVQRTSDGQYLIERATTNPEWWVAYYLPLGSGAQKLGERTDEAMGRALCEVHSHGVEKRA